MCVSCPGQQCFLGDLNIHCELSQDPHSKQLSDILASLDLYQYEHGPTHKAGHMLDLLITREDSAIVRSVSVQDLGVSDHYAASCQLVTVTGTVVTRGLWQRCCSWTYSSQ